MAWPKATGLSGLVSLLKHSFSVHGPFDLVGGSSRIPKVHELLQDFFKGKDLCRSINPDEAVAYGAAVQAALLNDSSKNVPKLVLQDVTPLSLGISVSDERIMDVIIPRNTSIPVKKTKRYMTDKDNLSNVLIYVYQGERARVSDNIPLDCLILSCSSHAPHGNLVDACFAIDENGILTVSAKERSDGNMNEITITNDKGMLSTYEVKKRIQEAEKYQDEDRKLLKKAKVMNVLETYIYKTRNASKNKDVNLKLSSQENDMINNALQWSLNCLKRKTSQMK